MKIAVIGANSYIARNVIYMLKQEGDHDIYLYDAAPEHVDGSENYTSINILDRDNIETINCDVDVIYMFIGKTGTVQGFDEYKLYNDINTMALLNVLDLMRKKESKAKIVFPSTRLVYKGVPGKLKEEATKEFKTPYAINKYACEQYLDMYHRMYGINYVIFRICVPYGTMIPNASSYGTAEFMLKQATEGKDISLYGGGVVRRTLTHMEDLCRALITGAKSEKAINDVYNIGGEDYSLKEMADLIAAKYGIKVISTEWPELALKVESNDTVFDSQKFDELVAFEYRHNFEDWCK